LVEFSVRAGALHDRPTDILWNGPALVEIVPEFYKRGRENFALRRGREAPPATIYAAHSFKGYVFEGTGGEGS
jgi:hypothetical protein